MVALLLAAILGYLLGGPFLAIAILVIGIAIMMVTDLGRALVTPMGVGLFLGFLVAVTVTKAIKALTGVELRDLPTWAVFSLTIGVPAASGLAADLWWTRNKASAIPRLRQWLAKVRHPRGIG